LPSEFDEEQAKNSTINSLLFDRVVNLSNAGNFAKAPDKNEE
jgi:hypothetical protein